jgi:hypothetical protein
MIDTRDNGLRQRPGWSEAVAHPVRSFHTLRHLQAKQVVYRAIRCTQPAGAHATIAEQPFLLPRRPSLPVDAPPAFDGRGFSFLNRRFMFDGNDRWHPRGADDLWIFNVHYFRFLTALDPSVAVELVTDWLDMNTDRRSAAWHAYPISQRVREWIEWLLAHPQTDDALRAAAMRSLAEQVESLRRRLEFDVMGNHLLENAITLCWAGLSFAGRHSDVWLAEGREILSHELRTQLLADGSHQERSPMYQALLTEALLRLAEVAARSPKSDARTVHHLAFGDGQRLLRSLAHLVHPDGGYALVNDSAFGVAPSFSALVRRFGLESGSAHRRSAWAPGASGYVGYADSTNGYLLFDGGPVGPDHQAGHGHADTLSFELSARGSRVLTDTGVFTYATGGARQHDRSTAAHNTIEIDGRDQAELWGAFRCARRVTTDPVVAATTRDGATIVGSYRGPGQTGPVAHRRSVAIQGRVVAFSDDVSASGSHRAVVRLHFAPEIEVRRTATHWTFGERGGRPLGVLVSPLEWSAATSPYHPEFGREIERPCLYAPVTFRHQIALKWWLMLR